MVNELSTRTPAGLPSSAAFAPATKWPAVLNVPAVTLSSTQPSGDQAQTTMTDPTGATYTYGTTISNAQSGRASGTVAMSAGDLIPANYGSGNRRRPLQRQQIMGAQPERLHRRAQLLGHDFFTWPPDPSVNASTGASNDWRQLYFLSSTGSPTYNSLASNTAATSTSSSPLFPVRISE